MTSLNAQKRRQTGRSAEEKGKRATGRGGGGGTRWTRRRSQSRETAKGEIEVKKRKEHTKTPHEKEANTPDKKY